MSSNMIKDAEEDNYSYKVSSKKQQGKAYLAQVGLDAGVAYSGHYRPQQENCQEEEANRCQQKLEHIQRVV